MTILTMENNSPCLCFGCGARILDRWLLCVSPDLQWHTTCLKCSECGLQLDEKCTCFMRNGKAFCKSDFIRLYNSNRCCKCKQNVTKSDLVMKVNNKIFHLNCFRCDSCSRRLEQGEHFTILKEETLLCKNDFEQMELANSENNFNKTNCRASTPMSTNFCPTTLLPPNSQHISQGFGGLVSGLMAPNCDSTTNLMNSDLNSSNCSSVSPNSNSNSSSGDFNGTTHLPLHHPAHLNNNLEQVTDSQNTLGSSHHSTHAGTQSISSSTTSARHSDRIRNPDQPKQTRVRTVLNDRQLQTLRSVYNQNPRPDALIKEQLVKTTQLNARVIRVWFQNKRCKDKKKNNQLKQQQQMERDGRQLQNIASMRGVPLVAMSPVPHDSPAQSYCSDIHVYEPNWTKFADCAAQGQLDCADPHFQHLINQMNGYETKDQKWTPNPGPHLPINNNSMNIPPPSELAPLQVANNIDSKNGIQMINSTDCSSNGSVLVNSSSNSNSTGPTLINPLNALNNPLLNPGTNLLNNLTTFDHNELRRSESVLRPDTPSDMSN